MSLVRDQPAIDTAVPTRLDGFLGKWFGDRSRAAIRAGFWSGSGFVTSQLLRTGSRLLLARVLLPKSAFGIWTLLSGFIAGLQMLSDVGIGPSIVQNKRGVEPRFLDTAFTIQVVRGGALWVIACLLAWPAARFLEVPSLTYLIPVAALTLLVGGFVNTAFFSWTRNMHLRPVTLLNIGAELAGVIATVVVALISPTIWALVAGIIATSVVGAAGTYFWGLRRSRFGWEKAAAQALLHFGIGTFLSTATWFMASQGERFVLTKFLAMQKTHEVLDAMGDYGVAAMLAGTTTAAISQVVTQVLFPSISRAMRDSVGTATEQYRKARWLALVLILGVTLPLALGGEWVIHLLLGDKWHEAGWMLRVLAVRGAFEMAQTLPSTLLMANAKLKYAVIANSVRVVLMFVSVPLVFAAGGLREVIWVLSLLAIPTYVVMIFGVWRTFPSLVKGEVFNLFVLILASLACTWPLIFHQ